MSSPKLRLLLDESVNNPLADIIAKLSSSAVYVRTNQLLKGKEDPEIAAEANRDGRTIVALDNDYKGIKVTGGVIMLKVDRLDEKCLIKIFCAFWKSGHRSKAKMRRTYLTNAGIRITNGEEVKVPWSKHPCAHRSLNR